MADGVAPRLPFALFGFWARAFESVAAIGPDLSKRRHRPVSPSALLETEFCTSARGSEFESG
jgi:hypothetical protein